MVNTLLEVYRFEAGRKTLSFFPIDLRALLQEVINELTPLAAEKKLAISAEFNQQTQVNKVMGDRLELHRLFTNLVGNAIKFTDTGAITIRFNPTIEPKNLPPKQQATAYVAIEIEDTGAGIAKDEQATMFERFRQGSHKRSGSGLGLYLSRRIVEAHQGTIQLSSELGKGSIFIVYLPA